MMMLAMLQGRMRLFLLSLFALLSTPALAAPFTIEETGASFFTLAEAVFAVGDGDATIRIAPGRYGDCAVQGAGRITYRAEKPLTAIFDGGTCEGKAVLVLRGRAALVDGLIFQNLRVPDGNGAGIRIERGHLTVSGSIFRDSEEGILGGGDDPASDIIIERSTFKGLGRCDRGLACAHSIYLSDFRSVTVRRSRFEKGTGGHYVKSRARWIEVSDCSFDDSEGRTTNYMIDLPEGGRGTIKRNVFVQGLDKENHAAFIAVAAEAQRNSSEGLMIIDNVAHQVRDAPWSTSLLADWSGSPKVITGNRIGKQVQQVQQVSSAPPSFTDKVKDRLLYYIGRAKEKLIG